MKFLEKDLEDIIWESNKEKLSERGLTINGKLFRQVRIGNYGIVDLIEFIKPEYNENKKHYKGRIIIYELKKDNISVSSFFQAINYKRGIQRYLLEKNLTGKYIVSIRLIGKHIDDNSSLIYLPETCSDVSLFKYEYGIEGLKFDSIYGYKLKEEGFKIKKRLIDEPF